MRFAAILCLGFLTAAYARPCTIFLVARGGQVLVGANEDMTNVAPYDKHWVAYHPASEKVKIGYVTFGYTTFPLAAQAGMNAKGLFYDYNALPIQNVGPKDKPAAGMDLGEKILASCATVAEALALIEQYDFVALSAGQMVLGDAAGASAIVERNAVTKRGDLDYQIGTNFRTSETPKDKIDCWRYKTCDSALGAKTPATPESVRKLLEETMPKDPRTGISWYSMVCDLKNARLTLFRKGDFTKAVIIDLKTDLQASSRRIDMDDLMSKQAKPYSPGKT